MSRRGPGPARTPTDATDDDPVGRVTSLTVVERILFLASDARGVIERIQKLISISARYPSIAEFLQRDAVDASEDDWLTLFVIGNYLVDNSQIATALTELRDGDRGG